MRRHACVVRITTLLCAVWLLAATRSDAQFLSGAVYGAITGPDGKPLTAVTVALGGPTKTRAVVTAPDGQFRFLGLDPGTYHLRVEAPGFEPATYPSVLVVPGRNTAVQVRLSPRP